MPRLLTTAELAELLHCSVRRIQQLVACGELGYVEGLGRERLYTEEDILALIERHRHPPGVSAGSGEPAPAPSCDESDGEAA